MGDTVNFPVIGYRIWFFDDRNKVLRSVYKRQHVWLPGEAMHAQCLNTPSLHSGPAPAPGCHCGLHGFHETWPDPYLKNSPHRVVGLTRGWGNIRLHHDGWRAQHAEVLAIVDTGGPFDQEAARVYQVPLIPEAALEYVAGEYGKFVPKDLRPESSVWAHQRALGMKEQTRGLFYILGPAVVLYMAVFALVIAIRRAWKRLRQSPDA